MQIFRFTSSKPSKSAIASDEKFIRLRTNSFVRYCPNKNYNPDVNQVHVVLFDSASTYSGMGAESGSGNSNVQKNKEVNADNKFGIDVILMNHIMPNIQNVIDLLGGD